MSSQQAAAIWSTLRMRFQSPEAKRLLAERVHSPAVLHERVSLVTTRTRQIAAVFSVLTILWIGIDAANVPWPQWGQLAAGRLVASLAFAACAARRSLAWPNTTVLRETGLLFMVPLVFFFYSNAVLGDSISDSSLATSTAYYYLPFILAAGLSLFPLTALESFALGSVMIAAMAGAIVMWPSSLGEQSAVMTLWRLTLIAAICGLAGVNQLQFLIRITEQATRDGLTGLLVRRVGEEILDNQFAYAQRQDLPFALLFIDLDNFKSVNDKFGHDAGDAVLRDAAAQLRRAFRHQDSLIRWGGEEFVVALPGTDSDSAETAVRRLADLGIGARPDRQSMTASIGIAERKTDSVVELRTLIELADRRMYQAKRMGRNRYASADKCMRWMPVASQTIESPAASS